MNPLLPIIGFSIIVFIIFMMFRTRYLEKKEWNNGISPAGEDWVCFDMDSQGGRGYKDSKDNYVWISYNVDNKEKE